MRGYTKDKIIVKSVVKYLLCAVKEKFYEIHEPNLLDFSSNMFFVPNKTLHGYYYDRVYYEYISEM